MSFLASLPLIGEVFKRGLDIVDDYVEDKDKSNELKSKLEIAILQATGKDKLFTRQGIAWTFHLFFWGHKFWTGEFPSDVLITIGGAEITVGIVYLAIVLFYYPSRAWEKFKAFTK